MVITSLLILNQQKDLFPKTCFPQISYWEPSHTGAFLGKPLNKSAKNYLPLMYEGEDLIMAAIFSPRIDSGLLKIIERQ